MIYPLSLEAVLQKIEGLHKMKPPRPKAAEFYAELIPVVRALQRIRNDAVHSVVKETEGALVFENRAKGRTITKEQILSCEELTNYASLLSFKFPRALGFKEGQKPHENSLYVLRHRPFSIFNSRNVFHAVTSIIAPGPRGRVTRGSPLLDPTQLAGSC